MAIPRKRIDTRMMAKVWPLAGTLAFLRCADLINTKKVKYGLVIGANCQVAEMGSSLETAYGAGAAAFILGDEQRIADVGSEAAYSTSFTTAWRSSGQTENSFYDDGGFPI